MKKVCYLRVLPEYDNKRTYVLKGYVYHIARTLIGNELLTLSEVARFNVPTPWLQVVKVDSSSVYYFFGARFCEEYEH